MLRPVPGGEEPEEPGIDVALLRQLLGDVESSVARLRAAVG